MHALLETAKRLPNKVIRKLSCQCVEEASETRDRRSGRRCRLLCLAAITSVVVTIEILPYTYPGLRKTKTRSCPLNPHPLPVGLVCSVPYAGLRGYLKRQYSDETRHHADPNMEQRPCEEIHDSWCSKVALPPLTGNIVHASTAVRKCSSVCCRVALVCELEDNGGVHALAPCPRQPAAFDSCQSASCSGCSRADRERQS